MSVVIDKINQITRIVFLKLNINYQFSTQNIIKCFIYVNKTDSSPIQMCRRYVARKHSYKTISLYAVPKKP